MAGESNGTIWQTLASWALHECISSDATELFPFTSPSF
jgi:hypothetical protein